MVEDMLNNKKLEIDKLEVPDELEGRLRRALNRVEPKKKAGYKWTLKVASLIIGIMLIGYNMDTLAFYGKRIMGFDEVMTDTLRELNELGKGQVIDKSYTFKNGSSVTLDGVMMDDNQLLMFYTIVDPRGNVSDPDIINTNPYIEGAIGKYYAGGGQGESNEAGTEIKWKTEFEKPYFFEKSLKWGFTLIEGNNREVGEIVFKLDRSKAMGHTLKKTLNKSIKIDQEEITFKSIVASPTVTYIEGSMQNIFELAKNEVKGEGFSPSSLNVRLIANGKEVQIQGSGMSTNLNGIKFNSRFDALPKDIKNLQIKVVSLQTDNKVNEVVKLSKSDTDKKLEILGQQIEINKVYESEGKTYVTITSEEDVALSKVYLTVDGKNIELKNTTPYTHDKKADGTILYTRSLCFEGTGKELSLKIKSIRYTKDYNEIIDVPID
jgi:hypothetical protein